MDIIGPEIVARVALAITCIALYAGVIGTGAVVFLMPVPWRFGRPSGGR